jgi:hypothetical protein
MPTPTGHEARAAAVLEQIKRRSAVHHEHTREVVRQELPEEIRELVLENARVATQQTIEIAELKTGLVELRRKCSHLEAILAEDLERRSRGAA